LNKIEIYNDNDKFYFRVLSSNGENIMISKGYINKKKCKKGIKLLKIDFQFDIDDLT